MSMSMDQAGGAELILDTVVRLDTCKVGEPMDKVQCSALHDVLKYISS